MSNARRVEHAERRARIIADARTWREQNIDNPEPVVRRPIARRSRLWRDRQKVTVAQ